MSRLKNWLPRTLLLIVLAISLEGCAHQGSLKVYDREFCGDLGSAGAYCKHAFIPGKRDVAQPAWDKERIGMICMKAEAENDIEVELDQACTELTCTYEQREELRQASVRYKTVKAKALEAKHQQEIP